MSVEFAVNNKCLGWISLPAKDPLDENGAFS